VGADGLRSVVARRLGLARLLPWPRRLALVTHYEGVADVGDFGEMHVERDGFVGIADVGAGLTTVALVVPASEARRLGGDPAAYLAAWLARRAHLAPRFARARRVDPVRTTGPFAASARRAWAPGAALVGDAADFFDPFTGEGVYCGLRGGELLAPHALAAARAGRARGADDALAAWGAARRREFRGKWAVERMIGVAVASPPLVDRAARVLSRRADMADLLVGVAGDFVPASRVLTLSYVWRLFLAPLPPRP
jgi:2-polyprenyl-6-methoxyphenol hydroxylase-like FAD-dependent oxidoreductase